MHVILPHFLICFCYLNCFPALSICIKDDCSKFNLLNKMYSIKSLQFPLFSTMFIHLYSVLKLDTCVSEYFGERPLIFMPITHLDFSEFLKLVYFNVLKNFKLSIKIMIGIPTRDNRHYSAKKLRRSLLSLM